MTGKDLLELGQASGLPLDAWQDMSLRQQQRWNLMAMNILPIEHDSCPVLHRAEAIWRSQLDASRVDGTFIKFSDREMLGAFLAGEGTITLTEILDMLLRLGYSPQSGFEDYKPGRTKFMVTIAPEIAQ